MTREDLPGEPAPIQPIKNSSPIVGRAMSEKTFSFSKPDAIEIAYIMQRNNGDAAFLHKLLVRAIILEDIYIHRSAR